MEDAGRKPSEEEALWQTVRCIAAFTGELCNGMPSCASSASLEGQNCQDKRNPKAAECGGWRCCISSQREVCDRQTGYDLLPGHSSGAQQPWFGVSKGSQGKKVMKTDATLPRLSNVKAQWPHSLSSRGRASIHTLGPSRQFLLVSQRRNSRERR